MPCWRRWWSRRGCPNPDLDYRSGIEFAHAAFCAIITTPSAARRDATSHCGSRMITADLHARRKTMSEEEQDQQYGRQERRSEKQEKEEEKQE